MRGLDTQTTRTLDEPRRPIPQNDGSTRGRRAAFWVFVTAEAVIFVALLWNFHDRWFIADEWEFLAGRTGGNLGDLFHPYHEHWSTLPILYYRLLWNLVGLRSYIPYLVSILVLHIAISALLRTIMIRARVLPWVATLGAVIFTLYGAGDADISYAFNIGFDGSVGFGLLYLLAVDHDGPANRNDALGVAAGLAGLMCSGIGVAMVVVVAMAVWVRHGVRRALLVTLPLAGIYVVWFATLGHGAYSRHSSLSELARFVVLGVAFTFSSLGHSPVVGVALAALLIAGLVTTIRASALGTLRTRYAAPVALLIGVVAFMIITGFGRANNSLPSTDTYAASRYLYVAAAMLLPAIAVAASQLISRWTRLWPVVALVLVVGIPGNIIVLHRTNYLHVLDSYRQFFLSIPRLPIATHLPRSLHPDPNFDSSVTVGWLLAGVQSGRIPPPSPAPTAAQRALWTLQLAWQPGVPAREVACQTIMLPALAHVRAGTRLTLDAPVNISYRYSPHRLSASIRLPALGRSGTFVSSWPMNVQIAPTSPRRTAVLCNSRP
jgi:hypothetical protein